jgi:hypothetical protein
VSEFCNADGSAWVIGRDCTEWGSSCGARGYCDDACATAEELRSNVGCEYWPTPLPNIDGVASDFDFRVVVANPGDSPARVRVLRGATVVAERTIPGNGLEAIVLPWVTALSFGITLPELPSVVVSEGGYRLISDTPVIVTQFNPFEYGAGRGRFSYSNDASLLLPTSSLTGSYLGVSYPPLSQTTAPYPGYIAVVGIAPGPTRVEVLAAGEVQADASGRIPRVGRGGTFTLTLSRGEVAVIASAPPPPCEPGRPGFREDTLCFSSGACATYETCNETQYDLTGTRVVADRPVAVFGGHMCGQVPYNVQACDHLEEQLAPIETWGREYTSAPMGPGTISARNLVRVLAAFDGTQLTIDPAPPSGGSPMLDAGEFVEFEATSAFTVSGSRAILATQFLLGQRLTDPPAPRGDPSLTTLVPSEQFRNDYTFILPTSYNESTGGQNHVLIVRPRGLALTVDGAPAASIEFAPSGEREVGVLLLDGGTHRIEAAEPFGVITYGLGQFTSYATPAGLDLRFLLF